MFKPGDVVIIPYPFTDQARTKKRPVLVLTAADSSGDFIGLAITSKSHHTGGFALEQHDMESGTLPKPSWIRADKVFTLNDSLLIKTVGRVRLECMHQALSALCGKLGCRSIP